MKNDENAESKNQQEEKLCSKCGQKLVTDWEKEHEICVQCNEKINYCPASIKCLNNLSGVYDVIGGLMIIASILVVIIYLSFTGFDFTPETIIMCCALFVSCLFVFLAYSTVSAVLKGIADIVEGIERINKNK